MIEVEDAQRRILSAVKPLGGEVISLSAGLGRILAEDQLATVDLPPFDNSAMDGYAVRAEDVTGASAERPAELRLVGKVAAGSVFDGRVTPGACVRLFTGSPLPPGADAVVMQEDTRLDPTQPASVFFTDGAKPGENVRFHGEDVKKSSVIARRGERLTAGRVSLLSALGCAEACVGRRPVIGLLATGSELREAGQPLAQGQIYESNRAGLSTLVAQAGGIPKIYPLVPDDLEIIGSVLDRALRECDAVVTSGGVSVGEWDLVKKAFQALGGDLAFWKIAARPGKPFVFGKRGDALFFGLPGNPVSAFVTFLVLTRPALLRLQGAEEWRLAVTQGILADPLLNPGDRRHFMRVKCGADGQVWSAGLQASHALGSLALANGLVDVPAGTSLKAGTLVPVQRWEL